jgi:hypothetical protein
MPSFVSLVEVDLSSLQVDWAAKILSRPQCYLALTARFSQRPQTSSLFLAKAAQPRSVRLAGACRRGVCGTCLENSAKPSVCRKVSGAVKSPD